METFIHDGMIFCFTQKSIKRGGIIGYYFDHLGLPHSIHEDSSYGKHIKNYIAQQLKIKEK